MAIDLNVYFDKISKLRMIHRVIIFIGTIVLVVGLYIWFVHIPKTGEISTLKSDLDKLERDISLAKIRTKDLDKLEAELAKAQEDLQFALKLLPTTSEIPSLLKNITKLGNDSNLEFLLFSPQRQVSKEFYVQIPVDIEVEGGYHDVALFFDRIGKLDRIVNVIDVNMAPVKEQNTTLRVRCKATTYRFKEIAEQESEPKKKKK
jgi:type IV pilus assembly protein PilO